MRLASRLRSRATIGALGIALSLAACDAGELSTTLDPVGTQVDVATTQGGFALAPVRSFAAMGPRIETALASYESTLRMTGSTASLLPLLAWNKTFVWDVATLR